MAQKVTVKEVKPAKDEKSPTVIITEDGSKMSGFEAGLKKLVPGDVLNVELEVKKGYTNITKFEFVSHGSVPAPGPGNGGPYQADPAKIASEEMRSRMHAAKDLWIAGVIDKDSPEVKKLRAWIMGEIAPTKAPEKPPVSKTTAEQDWANLKRPEEFKDKGDFWKRATNYFGKPQSELAVILELTRASDLQENQFDEAWDKLEKAIFPNGK